MDGILIIDKPAGITSHDVVARVRRALQTKRVGHTGTLDPFATGVMVVLVGRATRLAQFLDKDEKEYEAVMKFGFETDTGDITGTPKPETQNQQPITIADVEAVLPQFIGNIDQTPPMYSAKKVDGKKLYEHARKGETIERKPVSITITSLRVSVPPAMAGGSNSSLDTAVLQVACSAGTYIRTLAEDIARAAGSAAHLTELRRTKAGRFAIDQSTSLDDVSEDKLRSIDLAVERLPSITLSADRTAKTKQGMSTRIFETDLKDGDKVRMLSEEGELIAIGAFDAAESAVKPKVVLV